jgi:hypothetical protein
VCFLCTKRNICFKKKIYEESFQDCLPGKKFNIDLKGHDTHLGNSPKLKWTLDQLSKISTTEDGIMKVLYLAIRSVSKKWTMPIHSWKQALNHCAIMFSERFPERLAA